MTDLELVIANSPRLRQRTKEIYLANVREFISFSQGQFTGPVVELWRDTLNQTRKASTVNGKLSALRYASRRVAERAQDPRLDFARYAEMLKVERDSDTRRRALSIQEAERLVAACRGPKLIDLRDTTICILGFRTGLRRAGMATLTLDDIALPAVTATLKGGHRHTIHVDPETATALNAWLGALEQREYSKRALFVSCRYEKLGGPLTPGGLYKAIKRRGDAAGLRDFHPHIFRHSFVSWALESGVPPHRVAAMTGHKTDGMLPTYTTDLQAASVPVGSLLPPLVK